jgi:hypothetical protein
MEPVPLQRCTAEAALAALRQRSAAYNFTIV